MYVSTENVDFDNPEQSENPAFPGTVVCTGAQKESSIHVNLWETFLNTYRLDYLESTWTVMQSWSDIKWFIKNDIHIIFKNCFYTHAGSC